MCMMPCATLCQCVCAHCICGWAMWSTCQKLVRAQEGLRLKVSIIPACEDFPQCVFFFCTFFCSLLALMASIVH